MSAKRNITPLHSPAAVPPQLPPPTAPPPDPHRLVRLPEILHLLAIKKTKWWAMVKDGTAPAPVRLGHCTCWRYADVVALTVEGITNG